MPAASMLFTPPLSRTWKSGEIPIDLLRDLLVSVSFNESADEEPFLDATGHGGTLTPHGTPNPPLQVPGVVNMAANHQQSNLNYCDSSHTIYRFGGDFTIKVGIKPIDDIFSVLVARWDALNIRNVWRIKRSGGGGGFGVEISPDGGNEDIQECNNPTITSVGTWYLITVEHENGVAIRVRVNDGAWASIAYTSGIFSSDIPLVTAANYYPVSLRSNVHLDEMNIWSRRLTEAEHNFYWNAGAWRAYADF